MMVRGGAAGDQQELNLFSFPRSRSRIIEWYLQELGVGYSTSDIDMTEKEHKSPEFLKVNPFGKLPVLGIRGAQAAAGGPLNLFESGAILLYIADKYGGLATPEDRAEAGQWVAWANASLGPALFVKEVRERSLGETLGALDRLLAQREYLLPPSGGGDGAVSVADVAVGAYLSYVPLFLPDLDLGPWPAVRAYMARLAQRPAFLSTVGARVPPPPPPPNNEAEEEQETASK
ncbi:unnamed protein product [Heterosigma akashiwo]|eukprot:CAMPEP_0194595338 /NCGR_PEP_ID=MMETSP0292-20121207/24904_1 /TAXON_ID=39354 /ORGANISM="Heterosigma akashiwo, Strain CCMP2393" /LENGTH=231 /DNA_ID=CAMNT_0039455189 /DNA_START=100 /DNA_END=795 /DNA_ORIENTATION=+